MENDDQSTLDIIKELVYDTICVEPSKVKEESRFVEDLGADSLDMVELIMAVEDRFGIEIPDRDAEKITIVHEAVDYIDRLTAA